MTRLKHILIGRNPKRTLIRTLIWATGAWMVFGWLARPVKIQGISMEPTLHDRSIHFLNRTAYWRKIPGRGDMVAISMPGGWAYYMKRILGLPGETIAFDQGALLINGSPMAETYLQTIGSWNMPAVVIPDGQYFIAGDNRDTSFAGHTLGLVDQKLIDGELLK